MTEEIIYLREYVQTRSQPAFAELVRRYVDLVYSCARRQVGGDGHLAEDVTQQTFMLLASKAATVPTDRPLSAWLVKAAGYCAANARRARERRVEHERKAGDMARATNEPESEWESLSPLLDEGMGRLPRDDRDAVLLRFFEKQSLAQVGAALGISEQAAQKRVSRAVEKLRDFFQARGATALSAAALTTFLTAESIQAAPAGLATAVASSAGAAGSMTGKGAVILMASGKVKAAAIAAVAIFAGIGGAVAVDSYLSRSNQAPRAQTASPTPVASPASKFPVKFSDGTIVDVIALQDPNNANAWWTLDGSATTEPKFRADGLITMRYALARRLDMIVRTSGSALDRKSLAVQSDVPLRAPTLKSGNNTQQMTKVIMPVPMDAATGRIRVGLAHGAWTDELRLVCTPDQPPELGSTGAGFSFDGMEEVDGSTVVHFTHPPYHDVQEDRRVVVEADGKEVRHATVTSTGVRYNYTFRVPLAKVNAISVRSRGYEWVDLNDVAFAPTTQPTSVKVAAAPIVQRTKPTTQASAQTR